MLKILVYKHHYDWRVKGVGWDEVLNVPDVARLDEAVAKARSIYPGAEIFTYEPLWTTSVQPMGSEPDSDHP